ncbi:unnamed protein product [Owenia fusiformis]|uniref:Uncharacterized protein n=1 Tax=Owenia fusiformis TaxID=6347 RepID=A0A8J1U105_OWEFU|nr:unnamed protein product [Owenia fusiformis]
MDKPVHISNSNKFDQWLETITREFCDLDTGQRTQTLDRLISVSDSSQLFHLTQHLETYCKRDFLRQLPNELVIQILSYLDASSLDACCLVSQTWYNVTTSCDKVWKSICEVNGIATKENKSSTSQYHMNLYHRVKLKLEALQNGTAFEYITLEGHNDRIMAMDYSNGILATGSDDHSVRLWNASTGKCIKDIKTGHSVSALKFQGSYLVTGSYNATTTLWNSHTGEERGLYAGHVGAVFALDFNKDMDLLVTGSADSFTKLWHMSTEQCIKTIDIGIQQWVLKARIYDCKNDPNKFGLVIENYNSSSGLNFLTFEITQDDEYLVTNHLKWPICPDIDYVYMKDRTVSFCCKVHLKIREYNISDNLDIDHTCYDIINDHLRPVEVSTLLGAGKNFMLFEDIFSSNGKMLHVVSKQTEKCNGKKALNLNLMASLPSNARLGETTTLCNDKWLNGLDDRTCKGPVMAVALKNYDALLVKWKDKI